MSRKEYLYPEILFLHYAPPTTPPRTPYRFASLLSSTTALRDETAEADERSRFIATLEAAWKDGARGILVLGPNAFYAVGGRGAFQSFRGSTFDLAPSLNPDGHAWIVMATIDPWSRAAYIRNGHETYRSDLNRLRERVAGAQAPDEHFVTGIDATAAFAWLDAHDTATTVAVDIETDGLDALSGADVVCISLAVSPSEALCIPFRQRRGVSWWPAITEAAIVNRIAAFINSRRSVWHNGLYFDIPFLMLHGWPLELSGDFYDTLFMHREIEPDAPHSLAYVSSRYSQRDYWKDDFRNRQGSIYDMRPQDLWRYNARDAAATIEVYDAMIGLLPPDFSMASAPLLISKRMHRPRFDEADRRQTITEVATAIDSIETTLRNNALLPAEFNFDSAIHINAFIYGLKRTRTEERIVAEATNEIALISERLERFDIEHADWTLARAAAERVRFERALTRKQSTKRYAQAAAHLALMAAISPLYDLRRLSFTPRVMQNGLYSFDDVNRERLEASLARKAKALESRIAEHQSKPKPQQRFIDASIAEHESINALRSWLSLYETRQELISLAALLRENSDVTNIPLPLLRRFGTRVRPAHGSEFVLSTNVDLKTLATSLRPTEFPIVLSQKCVILEVPFATTPTSCGPWLRATTISEALEKGAI
jgi:hypothetical protein